MKLLLSCMSLACAIALSGCNTIAGAGRDIERGGEKLQDASARVRADWRASRDTNERAYDTARVNCDRGPAAERDACRDRARSDYLSRTSAARAAYKRSEMRAQTEEDRREEAYEAARERCDALRGPDEDRCVVQARTRYNR